MNADRPTHEDNSNALLTKLRGGRCLIHIGREGFIDGNKRMGLSAAVVFLYMNGWELIDPDEKLHPIMEDVAQGKIENLSWLPSSREWRGSSTPERSPVFFPIRCSPSAAPRSC